jgi:hypothetical protein
LSTFTVTAAVPTVPRSPVQEALRTIEPSPCEVVEAGQRAPLNGEPASVQYHVTVTSVVFHPSAFAERVLRRRRDRNTHRNGNAVELAVPNVEIEP